MEVLSHILAREDIAAGRLVKVMPAFPPVRLPITVVYASRPNLPLHVLAVLDFLVDAVSEDVLIGTAEAAAWPTADRSRLTNRDGGSA